MNVEEQLRLDLRRAQLPPGLIPPAGLADTVLATHRRQRRHRVLGTGLGVAVLAGVLGVAVALTPGPAVLPGLPPGSATEQPQDEPSLPSPGGGAQAIHSYTVQNGERSYVLDPESGVYVTFAFRVVLSPDLTQAAVVMSDRIGLVSRADLLRTGEATARWTDLPPGNGVWWSPDGRALLITTLDKTTRSFTAHRYDVATGQVTDTPISVNFLGGTVGWAPNSVDYLALLPGPATGQAVEPGGLQFLHQNGSVGRRVDVPGGIVRGADSYSPDRRYVIADASELMTAGPRPSVVVDLDNGEVAATIPAGTKPLGWYDATTVAHLDPRHPQGPVLVLLNVDTGTTRQVDAPGLSSPSEVRIGPTTDLSDQAARRGF